MVLKCSLNPKLTGKTPSQCLDVILKQLGSLNNRIEHIPKREIQFQMVNYEFD